MTRPLAAFALGVFLFGQVPDVSAQEPPKEPVPPVTEADRAAAFPSGLDGHAVHDRKINYFVLFDQLEWQGGPSGGFNLDNNTWIGGDIDRLWLRVDTETENRRVDHASVDALWGHSISRWWDVVAGVRQDFRPGHPQAMAAVGIQGLAPYWFEVQATAYVGGNGAQVRLEAEYDVLLTNRLIAQPLAEMTIHGKSDRERRIGAGPSALETGLRIRYEIRREFAPYVGITWTRKMFGTADFAREDRERVSRARFTVGLRTWF